MQIDSLISLKLGLKKDLKGAEVIKPIDSCLIAKLIAVVRGHRNVSETSSRWGDFLRFL